MYYQNTLFLTRVNKDKMIEGKLNIYTDIIVWKIVKQVYGHRILTMKWFSNMVKKKFNCGCYSFGSIDNHG